MQNLVTQLEGVPLTGEDLVMMATKMGNANVKFYLYAELENIRSVEQLLGDSNTAFILFDIRSEQGIDPVGHWANVMKNDHGIIYYDPYGLSLGQDLEITGEPAYLNNILSGMSVDMNAFRDQKFKDELNTCGRHCAVRSVFWFLTNPEYQSEVIAPLRKGMFVRDPDVFVSLMTAFLDDSDKAVKAFFVNPKLRPAMSLMPPM